MEIFAAVVTPMSNKCFFAVGVKRGCRIRNIDEIIAFLYRFLDEIIYIKQPHLFATKLDKVCKLIKALWTKTGTSCLLQIFVEFLKKLGFVRFELDHGIFISTDKQLFISVYVDDLLLFGANIFGLEDIQQKLHNPFKMTDLDDISHYLRMQVNYVVGEKITLYQSTYLKKILDRFKMI